MNKKEICDAEDKARSACMVVLNPNGDGSMLAITRKQDYANIGLPGGKIDMQPRELSCDAAVRETLEETGILVDKKTIIPVVCQMAKTLICFTYFAPRIIGGTLLPESKEGMPVWVHPHMLLKDTCVYKKYNIAVFERLLRKALL